MARVVPPSHASWRSVSKSRDLAGFALDRPNRDSVGPVSFRATGFFASSLSASDDLMDFGVAKAVVATQGLIHGSTKREAPGPAP